MTEITLTNDAIKQRKDNCEHFFSGFPEDEVLLKLKNYLITYLNHVESQIDESEGNQ